MYRLIILSIALSLSYGANALDINQVRKQYFSATDSKEKTTELVKMCEGSELESNHKGYGYLGVAYTMMAQYAFNPATKLKLFNTGSGMLDMAIKQHPDDAELRFLRLTIQVNAPRFLGYNKEKKEDKNKVLMQLAKTNAIENDKYFTEKVVTFLKSLDFCTASDLTLLNQM